MGTTATDRVEQSIELRAPQARVWRALTDAEEFGTWFRAKLEGRFALGQTLKGNITYPGYEHLRLEVTVVTLEAQQRFAFRWHPYAIDPHMDYSKEPTTLVEFRLQAIPEGTRLTVVESGFDQLPPERRELAFRMNQQGWSGQMANIQHYVSS